MQVMQADKQVTLDCSWVTGFHLGLECTGSVPVTTGSPVEATRLDCIQDCTRYLAVKILLHQESFQCRQGTMHPCTPEFHLESMESCVEIPCCCLDLHQLLQTFQVLYNHHHKCNQHHT